MFWKTRWLDRLVRDRRGSVATIFAFSLPLVVGAAGLGAETTYWYVKRLDLQTAADAASYAGAIEKRSGSSGTVVEATATAVAEANGYDSSIGTIEVNSPPTSGSYTAALAVEVIIRQPAQRFFTKYFTGEDQVDESARAVSVYNSAANACVLALSPNASKAALFSGSSLTTLTKCAVMANSSAADAIKIQGSARLSTSCLISGGGVSTTTGLTMTDCSSAITYAPTVADPFATLPVPTSTVTSSSNVTALQPGKYTSGLSINANTTKTMAPGTYIISGGNFDVKSGATLTCPACTGTAGVTIYLSGGSRVSINGNATIQLSAPTTGTYAGVLFFSDRSNSGGSGNVFNGTAQSKLTGAIYAANQAVKYLGNFSGNNGCMHIVALTVEWSGNTSVSNDCSAYGMTDIKASQLITLAE